MQSSVYYFGAEWIEKCGVHYSSIISGFIGPASEYHGTLDQGRFEFFSLDFVDKIMQILEIFERILVILRGRPQCTRYIDAYVDHPTHFSNQ